MPDITISVTNAQAQRIISALESATESEVALTAADVRAFLVNNLKQLVRTQEREAAARAIVVEDLVL